MEKNIYNIQCDFNLKFILIDYCLCGSELIYWIRRYRLLIEVNISNKIVLKDQLNAYI